MIGPQLGSEPLVQCTVALISLKDIDSKVSGLCIAEQTDVQVEQTKQGVNSSLPPPHQKRICIYGALPRHPPGNTALFLTRQGHRELSFSGGPQHTNTHAHICLRTKTKRT